MTKTVVYATSLRSGKKFILMAGLLTNGFLPCPTLPVINTVAFVGFVADTVAGAVLVSHQIPF